MATTASSAGPLLELTLESLEGIFWRQDADAECSRSFLHEEDCGIGGIPNVTARVAFSGSAKDMQVGSSSVCVQTGQPMVESDVCSPPEGPVSSPEGAIPLVARWRRECSEDSLDGKDSASDPKPHLTIPLPEESSSKGLVSLSRMNRDCRIVQDSPSPSLDETETSEASCVGDRGGSVVWSASGGSMPEIVELQVVVMTEDMHRAEGIAYLVFDGQADEGTTVMDLAVKKPPRPQPPSQLYLWEDARLRVSVTVRPTGVSPVEADPPLRSRSILEKQLEPILKRLRNNEQAAMQRNARVEDEELPRGQRFLCQEFSSWKDVLVSVATAVTRCDASGGMEDKCNASMASTIATPASLNI